MNNIKKLSIGALLLAIIFLSSCKKDYLTETPVIGSTTSVVYTSKAGFVTGLYGLYNLFRQERAGSGVISGNAANYTNNMVITPAIVGVDNAYSCYPAAGQPEYNFNNFGATLNSSSADINYVFNWLYNMVNAANVIINQANATNVLTAQDKGQIVGEAKLFRALSYRHLTYLWGAVPLNLGASTDVSKNDWYRTSVDTVRMQIIKDLLDAEAGMSPIPPDEGRFPQGVATHYLAEMYLATGQNQNAQTKAQSLINSGLYSLVTNRYGVNAAAPGTAYSDMFLNGNSDKSQGNTEALYVFKNLYPSTAPGFQYNIMRRWWVNRYTSIAINGIVPVGYTVANGGRGIGRFAPTKWAALNYEPNDVRGGMFTYRYFWIMNSDESGVNLKVLPGVTKGDTLWVEKNVTGSGASATVKINYRYILTNATTLPTGHKLKDTIRTTPITYTKEPLTDYNWFSLRKWDYAPSVSTDIQQTSNCDDNVYLRLADTYLLLAEAQYNLGNAAGAAQTINALRARANASLVTANQVNIDFIMDERSRELISEEHRRYTLLRVRDPQNPTQPIWFRRTQQYNAVAGPFIQLRDTLLPIPQSVISANLGLTMPQNPGY
jgi:hypothetical protein